MKSLSRAFAVLALVALVPAQALADKAQKWGGIYIGMHGGAALADLDWGLTYPYGAAPPNNSFDIGNGVLGVHAGAQRQFGSWVAGVEVAYTSGPGSQTINGVNLWSPGVGTLTADIGPILTVSGRLGYDFGNLLGYVKAGYATANIGVRADDNVPPDFGFDVSHRHHGWTVGVGGEIELGRNIFFGLEYNYIDLGRSFQSDVVVLATSAPLGTTASNSIDTSIHSFLARLTYKFPH